MSGSLKSPAAPGINIPYELLAKTTERLLLRAFDSSDLDDVHDYQSREDVVKFLQWAPHSREDSTERLAERIRMTRLDKDGDGLVFAVEPQSGPYAKRVIGEVILMLDSAADARLEVGWIFNPAVRGQGYAEEAAKALLRVCFEDLSGHKVIARLDPRNLASSRLCERLGMRPEALLRDDSNGPDGWHDTAIYSLLAHERGAPLHAKDS